MAMEKWPGGFIREEKNGRKNYVIRKMIGGVRREVSTRRSTLSAAMKELEKFEADPFGYCARGEDAVRITTDLAREFRDYCLAKGATTAWVDRQVLYLAWWTEKIGVRDLRRLSLRDVIIPALEKTSGRRQRIAVLKAFYGWLRTERMLLVKADDPTADLKSEQARPAQWETEKYIPAASYRAVRKKLSDVYRDIFDLLAGTGWHLTEVQRFACGGEVLPAKAKGTAAVLLCPLHKSGAPHRTSVSKQVAAAARRVRKRGSFSSQNFYRAVREACDDAGVPRFAPGWFRHTIARIAVENGEAELVPGYLGHRSASTTKKFYATLATPPKVKTLA